MTFYQPRPSGSSLLWRALLASGVAAVLTLSGVAAIPAVAATVCNADTCVVVPDTLQTPLGLATVTVSPANVVTVVFVATSSGTFVIGSPFTLRLSAAAQADAHGAASRW